MSSRAKKVKSAPTGTKRAPQNGRRRSSTSNVATSAAGRPDTPVDDRGHRRDAGCPDVERKVEGPAGAGASGGDGQTADTSQGAVGKIEGPGNAGTSSPNTGTTVEPHGPGGEETVSTAPEAHAPDADDSSAPGSDTTTTEPAAAGGTPPPRPRRQLLFTAVIPLASIPLVAGLALLVSFVFFPEDETNPVSQAVEQQQRGPTETLTQGRYVDADGNEFDLVVKAVDPAVVAEKSANRGAGCASEVPLDYYDRGLLVEVSRPAGEQPVTALPRVAATGGLVAFPRDAFGCSWASADIRDRTLDAGQSTDVVGFLEPQATQVEGGELELRVGPIGDDEELARVALDRF